MSVIISSSRRMRVNLLSLSLSQCLILYRRSSPPPKRISKRVTAQRTSVATNYSNKISAEKSMQQNFEIPFQVVTFSDEM